MKNLLLKSTSMLITSLLIGGQAFADSGSGIIEDHIIVYGTGDGAMRPVIGDYNEKSKNYYSVSFSYDETNAVDNQFLNFLLHGTGDNFAKLNPTSTFYSGFPEKLQNIAPLNSAVAIAPFEQKQSAWPDSTAGNLAKGTYYIYTHFSISPVPHNAASDHDYRIKSITLDWSVSSTEVVTYYLIKLGDAPQIIMTTQDLNPSQLFKIKLSRLSEPGEYVFAARLNHDRPDDVPGQNPYERPAAYVNHIDENKVVYEDLSQHPIDPPVGNYEIPVTVHNNGTGAWIGLGRIFGTKMGGFPVQPFWAPGYMNYGIKEGGSHTFPVWKYGSTGDFGAFARFWLTGCGSSATQAEYYVNEKLVRLLSNVVCSSATQFPTHAWSGSNLVLPDNTKSIDIYLSPLPLPVTTKTPFISKVQVTTYKS